MVGALSFSQPCLWIQSPRQSLPKICCCHTSVNCSFPLLPLLLHKTRLTIPANTPFLYTSSIFHLPIFWVQLSLQSASKVFSLPQSCSQFRLCQGTNEQKRLVRTDIFLISLYFAKVQIGIKGPTITDSLLLNLKKLTYCR